MSTNRTQDDNTCLDNALRKWVVEAPLPPGFQDQVWQRIARAETRVQPGTWPALERLIDSVLPRPKFAFAYLSVLLLLGVTAGSVLAQRESARTESELVLRYVQSIDPYRSDAPHP